MLKYLIYIYLLVTSSTLYAQDMEESYDLPYPTHLYQEIKNNHDEALQQRLESIITRNQKWSSLVRQKKMSVGLVDLRQVDNIRYASVNGDHMVYAASLPKIAVLLAAVESVKEGCLEYTPNLQKDLRNMIAKSNNAATTRVIELIGFDKIADVLTREMYELYDMDNGGLWVGKKYAKSGKRKPDPIKGISHAANVDQVCRFYTMLAYGKLVDSKWNDEMMRYLVSPEINHKFMKSLNKRAPEADVYRKSGSWRQYHADSALVFGENGRRYILVALIEDSSGSKICTQLVKEAEVALGLYNNIPTMREKDGPTLSPAK